ncbi:MAG: glycosyltransferase family 2 protein [Nitrospirota bacterium]
MSELSVSIISHDGKERILACLKSVFDTADGLDMEVIVVENASSDGSAEAISEKFPQVKLIRNMMREGFSANHNKALRQARGSLVLLLNDDTLIHPGALKTMVDFMRANPRAGAAGAMLLNPDGTVQYAGKSAPTVLAAIIVSLGLHRLFPDNPVTSRYYGRKSGSLASGAGPEEVESVNGAAMIVRHGALEKAGYLDEGFFLFCEDVDLSIRIRQAGYKLYFLPDARVTHIRGASTGGRRIVLIYHLSLFRFYRKHYSGKKFFLINWLVYLGIALRLMVYMIYGSVRKRNSEA